MIEPKLKNYIEEHILPLYASFDKAHNTDHAQTVISESAQLATHYDVDERMVYVVAAFHDVGLCEGRERHHIVSGEILMTDRFIAEHFTKTERQTMRDAIEDHRASAAGEPRTIYGKIVAEADRIISPEITLRRTVQYGLERNPTATKEQHFERFTAHLTNKYGKNGYLKLWIPYSKNAERLELLRALIENSEELYSRFSEIYNSEGGK